MKTRRSKSLDIIPLRPGRPGEKRTLADQNRFTGFTTWGVDPQEYAYVCMFKKPARRKKLLPARLSPMVVE